MGESVGFGTRLRRGWRAFTGWLLPRELTRRARVFAWLSLVTELAIVGTGGAVRLTGSGLGCPTWPLCTPDSLVPVPELGLHALIEFSNRMMSGVVAVVALFTFLFLLRQLRPRPALFWLSFALGVLVLVQAAIGGVTVLSSLESYIVGLHFVLSAIMVVLAAALVWCVHLPMGRVTARPGWLRGLGWLTAAVGAITVLVGVLTTGSGPHAGDPDIPRNGLPTELMEHLHAWPAYALFALTVILLVAVWRSGSRASRDLSLGLLAVEFLQIAVGLYQSRNGLPPLAVGVHMVLSCLLLAIMTGVVLSLTRPRD